MAFRDLIPWSRSQQLAPSREAYDPFFALHREVNRLFDDVFRGIGAFGGFGQPLLEGQFGWPKVELHETDASVIVSAELPGLSEKDLKVEIANGVLSIEGEKKAERNGEGRFFTERYYGAFARRIPLDDVQADKAIAEFKNGVLTVTVPKAEKPAGHIRQIPIRPA